MHAPCPQILSVRAAPFAHAEVVCNKAAQTARLGNQCKSRYTDDCHCTWSVSTKAFANGAHSRQEMRWQGSKSVSWKFSRPMVRKVEHRCRRVLGRLPLLRNKQALSIITEFDLSLQFNRKATLATSKMERLVRLGSRIKHSTRPVLHVRYAVATTQVSNFRWCFGQPSCVPRVDREGAQPCSGLIRAHEICITICGAWLAKSA